MNAYKILPRLLLLMFSVLSASLMASDLSSFPDNDQGIEKVSFQGHQFDCCAILCDSPTDQLREQLMRTEQLFLTDTGKSSPIICRNSRIQYNYPFVNPRKLMNKAQRLALRE